MVRDVWISPSMIEVAELCVRKSWFKRRAKLPEVMKGSAAIGTALHGVVERYLLADDLGRDRDGNPVNLYPAGWHVVTERDGQSITLSPAEQILVQKLVDKAIEAGHLVREPGRQIEAEWRIRAPGFENVVIPGKMDVSCGASVTDHKTVKSMKWAKSPKGLAESIQMNLYVLATVERMLKAGEPTPDNVTISHVAYCKDPDDLRTRLTSTVRPVTAARAFYQTVIRPLIEKMLATENVQKWHEIEDPENMAKACNAFGGCSFASICQGREGVEDYRKRMERHQASRVDLASLSPRTSQETKPMGKFDILSKMGVGAKPVPPAAQVAPPINQTPPPATATPAAETIAAPPAAPPPSTPKPSLSSILRKPGAVAPPPAAAPAPSPAPAALPPVQAPQQIHVEVPPWAHAGCTSCASGPHPGWSTKGAPCRICDSMQKRDTGPQSTWFNILGQGREATWTAKPEFVGPLEDLDALSKGEEEASAEIPGTGGEVAVEHREDVGSPVPDAVVETLPDGEAEMREPTVEEEQIRALGLEVEDLQGVTGKKKTGRPRVGMTILIGCAVTRMASRTIVVHQFDQIAAETFFQIAAANKATTYFDMDAFARRDAVGRVASIIADRIGNSWLVVSSSALGSPDHRHLLAVLRPFAGNVIESTAS